MEELIGKNMDDLFPSAFARASSRRKRVGPRARPSPWRRNRRPLLHDDQVSDPDRRGAALPGRVTIDVTEHLRAAEEKIRLEDQLRQAQKVDAIGRLAGGVAHDFNNLTAIVLGYGEMLLGQLGPEDPARNAVEQIVAAGRRSADADAPAAGLQPQADAAARGAGSQRAAAEPREDARAADRGGHPSWSSSWPRTSAASRPTPGSSSRWSSTWRSTPAMRCPAAAG